MLGWMSAARPDILLGHRNVKVVYVSRVVIVLLR
jgi:hypothetical protein